MSPAVEPHVLFTFQASHHAFWAEDLAGEKSIPAELVPAPSESDTRCGLALRAAATHTTALEAVFRTEGIGFSRWNDSEG